VRLAVRYVVLPFHEKRILAHRETEEIAIHEQPSVVDAPLGAEEAGIWGCGTLKKH
jgi:hypothetical protein